MITAVVKTLHNGYPSDRELLDSLKVNIGDEFQVDTIKVGSSTSTITLSDFKGVCLNSVNFDFLENGKELNIYADSRFNSYLKAYFNI